MTRKRFQKLYRALLARSGVNSEDAEMIRMINEEWISSWDKLSYARRWSVLNAFFNHYGVGVKQR